MLEWLKERINSLKIIGGKSVSSVRVISYSSNSGKIFSRTFANGTWGEATGKRLGNSAWKVNAGPMKNHCNFIRFTKKKQIKVLFQKFKLTNIEKISFSLRNQKYKINEWLIYGKKNSKFKK